MDIYGRGMGAHEVKGFAQALIKLYREMMVEYLCSLHFSVFPPVTL